METVLLVIHLLLAIALISVVLVQRTAQDGGGLAGGSSTMGGLFTARGSANLLTRTTAILAALFIVTSLMLGIMASHGHKTRSLVDQIDGAVPSTEQSAPATEGETQTQQEVPAAPAAPSVPRSK